MFKAHTVLEKLHITEIRLEEQSQIHNNRVPSAIRTQTVARGGNENRNEGAVASSTAEDLSKILNNIRKTKEKTAFDVMVQERSRKKKKPIIQPRNVNKDSDSDDEFRPTTKRSRKSGVSDDELFGENQIESPTGSDRVSQLINRSSEPRPLDEVGANLVDGEDEDDPLPLFGEFINAKSKCKPTADDKTGPSTAHAKKSTECTVQSSKDANKGKIRNSDRLGTSQVAGPSHFNAHRSSRDDNMPLVSPVRAPFHQASGLSSRHRELQDCGSGSPSVKKKRISSSTINKLKKFAISPTPATETLSVNEANGMPSSSADESRLQTTSTETSVSGNDVARESVSNAISENDSHKEISSSTSSVPPGFASSGFVGSLSLFAVDHDDLSILDDF